MKFKEIMAIGLKFYCLPDNGLEARFDGGYIQITSTIPPENAEPKFFVYGYADKKKFEIDKDINSIYEALEEANKWWSKRLANPDPLRII